MHDIIVSSLVMAYKIILGIITNKKPKSYLSYQPIKHQGLMTALKANAITITPGTIAIEVDEKQITIHNFD
jgi:multisubunit Na+/H+ antiporter MnhE subunit